MSESPDMRRDALLRRAIIPKGHRPRTLDDIERFLDTIDAEPLDDQTRERMLRKLRGEEPMFAGPAEPAPHEENELTEAEREMAALYRSRKQPLPPDLDAKIRAMEQRAAKRPPSDEESSSG